MTLINLIHRKGALSEKDVLPSIFANSFGIFIPRLR